MVIEHCDFCDEPATRFFTHVKSDGSGAAGVIVDSKLCHRHAGPIVIEETQGSLEHLVIALHQYPDGGKAVTGVQMSLEIYDEATANALRGSLLADFPGVDNSISSFDDGDMTVYLVLIQSPSLEITSLEDWCRRIFGLCTRYPSVTIGWQILRNQSGVGSL